jgi:hypothetical protein
METHRNNGSLRHLLGELRSTKAHRPFGRAVAGSTERRQSAGPALALTFQGDLVADLDTRLAKSPRLTSTAPVHSTTGS